MKTHTINIKFKVRDSDLEALATNGKLGRKRATLKQYREWIEAVMDGQVDDMHGEIQARDAGTLGTSR